MAGLEQSQTYATASAENGPAGNRGRIYRHVNDRIRELSGLYDHGEPLQMFCECGERACHATIAVDPGRYEDVRDVGTRFFVAPGHAAPDDTVVERSTGLWVVEDPTGRNVAD